MRDFKSAYQDAVNELPKYSIDAERLKASLGDKAKKHSIQRKAWTAAAVAASLFLLCGVGTAAYSLYTGRVTVNQNGFSIVGGEAKALSEEADAPDAGIATIGLADGGADEYGYQNPTGRLTEEFFVASVPQEGEASEYDAQSPAEDLPEAPLAASVPEDPLATGVPQEGEASEYGLMHPIGGLTEEFLVCPVPDGEQAKDQARDQAEELVGEEQELEGLPYASLEELSMERQVEVPSLPMELLGGGLDLVEQEALYFEDTGEVLARLDYGTKTFFLTQADHRGSLGYASSYAYPGEAVNERVVSTDQGYAWTVIDCQEEGEVVTTCAAIALEGRDVTVQFHFYEKDEIDAILKQIDFSMYYEE